MNESKTVMLGLLLSLLGCRATAESYCESFPYTDNHAVLSIPQSYYARPRSTSSTISLMLVYKDLTAPKRFDQGYDPNELVNQDWQVNRSNYTALVQIYRDAIRRPTTISDFQDSYPNLREVSSDWRGWQRLEECRTNCTQVFYISDAWQAIGVDYVLCYEVKNRNPLLLGCSARDRIEGLYVDFFFPAAKKEHFKEFREKIVTFIDRLIADGASNCSAVQ